MRLSFSNVIGGIKHHPVRNTVFGLVLVGLIAAVWLWNPLKVTDPHDPRFDPKKFSFHDYFVGNIPETEKAIHDAVATMFPQGTPRSYVEEIFAEIGLRYRVDPQNRNIISYADEPLTRDPLFFCSSGTVTIQYAEDRVHEIVRGGVACGLIGWSTWDGGTPLKPEK